MSSSVTGGKPYASLVKLRVIFKSGKVFASVPSKSKIAALIKMFHRSFLKNYPIRKILKIDLAVLLYLDAESYYKRRELGAGTARFLAFSLRYITSGTYITIRTAAARIGKPIQ